MSPWFTLWLSARRVAVSALFALLVWGVGVGPLAYAASPGASAPSEIPEPEATGLPSDELEALVGPVALYPDELLAIVLPASTYPIQIVQAQRFLQSHDADPDLQPDEEWDPSVLGLLNYPEVIDLMNEDLDWTWKLGEAVVDQQEDVMDAVQSFRGKAHAAGNLRSDDKMTIVEEKEADTQIIVIESASPEVIYVPSYQPSTVIVQQPAPVTYVYSSPYPYYYRPAAAFWTGLFVGAAVGYGLRWGRYGRGGSVKVNRNVNVNVNRPNDARKRGGGGSDWKADRKPGSQSGARPGGGDRPGSGSGSRPGTGTRPGSGAGNAPGSGATRPSTGDRSARPSTGGGPSTGSRDRASSTRPSTSRSSQTSGRNPTKPSTSQRSSGGSFGGYKSGSKTRANSSRGASSRGRSGGGRRR